MQQPPSDWRLADNFWNLRDDAFDHPERWEGLEAADIFQRLSELVEEAEDQGQRVDWLAVSNKMIDWRASQANQRPDGAG